MIDESRGHDVATCVKIAEFECGFCPTARAAEQWNTAGRHQTNETWWKADGVLIMATKLSLEEKLRPGWADGCDRGENFQKTGKVSSHFSEAACPRW